LIASPVPAELFEPHRGTQANWPSGVEEVRLQSENQKEITNKRSCPRLVRWFQVCTDVSPGLKKQEHGGTVIRIQFWIISSRKLSTQKIRQVVMARWA
jgi:hypothetical protein